MPQDNPVKIVELDKPNTLGYTMLTQAVVDWLNTLPEPKEVCGTIAVNEHAVVQQTDPSHRVTNLRIEDGVLVGDVETLQTRWGYILEHILPQDFAIACNVEVMDGNVIKRISNVTVNAVAPGTKA